MTMRIGYPLILAAVVLALPLFAYAKCDPLGYTIVYVNGILTSEEEASADLSELRKLYGTTFNAQHIFMQLGYNASHLAGYGDEIESISQALGSPISDYDLDTILDQIAKEIGTRKVLLIGHSQGTFYTNELYDYLVKNGVPPDSLAVYNLAMPASTVAGEGLYLTSGNDKLINQVRIWDAEAGAPGPLPANILIPTQPGDAADIYGGHHFGSDYLAGAPSRILADIETSLSKLSATSEITSVCFSAPSLGTTYEANQIVYALADPAAAAIDIAASKTAGLAAQAASAIVSIGNDVTQIVNSALSDAFFSVFPKPNAENAGAVFSVEKALYGSSLSEADYEALLQGRDIPEDEPVQKQAEPSATPRPASTPAPTDAIVSLTTSVPPPTAPPPIAQSAILPTSEPAQISSISPGFGGGGSVADATPTPPPAPDFQDTSTTSDTDNQSQTDETQAATSSGDQLPDSNATTTATSTDDTTGDTATLTSCGQPTVQVFGGPFFSDQKDDAEYSRQGYLEYHFKTAENGGFRLSFSYYDDQCNNAGPTVTYTPIQVALATGDFDWSVRFTSQTHFDVWDDDAATIIGSVDLRETMPTYTSISFKGFSSNFDGTLISRGVKIKQNGHPPSFQNPVAEPRGCPDVVAQGYFFDPSYQSAEYVGGLLRVHLRLLTPYNDGRLFRAEALAIGSDCSIPPPSFGFGFPQTSLTSYIRYYSLRMANSTHWMLWDDENDAQMQCDAGCEGDIPDGTSLISFYASIDSGASTLRTTPFPPTAP